MQMKYDKIIYEVKENIGFVTLNNPDKMNCIGFDLLNALDNVIERIKTDSNVKVVIIKGAGGKAFSAGGDLKEFRNLKPDEEIEWIELGNSVFNKIESLSKPTIAFIDGYALGGGLELALACDLRIGTSNAVLSFPEIQHGWLPGWGGMVRMRRLFGESVAKEVIFLCEKINAEKALQFGIINRLVDSKESEEFKDLIEILVSLDTSAFAITKAAIANEYRKTSGSDVNHDVLATKYLKKKAYK